MCHRSPLFLPALLTLAATLACSPLSISPHRRLPAAPSAPPPVPRTPDEPYVITGSIPFTSPFFLDGIAEPFVLLEDEAGFVHRDKDFVFPLESQTIGPVALVEDGLLSYTLPLPARPLGTMVDVDNDGGTDRGLMVFAVAYWSNTWGDPFLEPRDGRGWSNAYTSAHTDPYRQDEIDGGTPRHLGSGRGPGVPHGLRRRRIAVHQRRSDRAGRGRLQPGRSGLGSVPGLSRARAGYRPAGRRRRRYGSRQRPTTPTPLKTLFEKVSREYPFTEDKAIDWPALHETYSPSTSPPPTTSPTTIAPSRTSAWRSLTVTSAWRSIRTSSSLISAAAWAWSWRS